MKFQEVTMSKQILIAIDQLINTLWGGWADETISARLWRNQNNSWWWAFWLKAVNTLFFWQNNHCRGAYNSELRRKQLPKEYQ